MVYLIGTSTYIYAHNIGKRSTQEELRRVSGVAWRSTRRVTKTQDGATCAGAWPNSTRPTLQSASFRSHLAKMDLHEDRWPRHLHLVHLVLPTVHLLRRSRSVAGAGALREAGLVCPPESTLASWGCDRGWRGGRADPFVRSSSRPRRSARSLGGRPARSSQIIDVRPPNRIKSEIDRSIQKMSTTSYGHGHCTPR
jgi:hypothetical protein